MATSQNTISRFKDPAIAVAKRFRAARKAHGDAVLLTDVPKGRPVSQADIRALEDASREIADAEWALAVVVPTTAAGHTAKLRALAKLDTSELSDLWPAAITSLLRSPFWLKAAA